MAIGGFSFRCCKHHLNQFRTQVTANHRPLAGSQHRFVHIKFIRIDGALHHSLTQAIARRDEHHIFKTRLGIDSEHHTRSPQIGTNHSLHASRQSHISVRKPFVHPVTDGAIVVQGGKYLFHFVQYILNADHIQEGFLLTGKGCIRQILGCSRRANSKGCGGKVSRQANELSPNGLLQISWKWLCLHHRSYLRTYADQRTKIIGVQYIQQCIDAIIEVLEAQELTKSVGRGCETRGYTNVSRQLGNHLSQTCVLPSNKFNICHPQLLEGHCQGLFLEKSGHEKAPKLKTGVAPESSRAVLLYL